MKANKKINFISISSSFQFSIIKKNRLTQKMIMRTIIRLDLHRWKTLLWWEMKLEIKTKLLVCNDVWSIVGKGLYLCSRGHIAVSLTSYLEHQTTDIIHGRMLNPRRHLPDKAVVAGDHTAYSGWVFRQSTELRSNNAATVVWCFLWHRLRSRDTETLCWGWPQVPIILFRYLITI